MQEAINERWKQAYTNALNTHHQAVNSYFVSILSEDELRWLLSTLSWKSNHYLISLLNLRMKKLKEEVEKLLT